MSEKSGLHREIEKRLDGLSGVEVKRTKSLGRYYLEFPADRLWDKEQEKGDRESQDKWADSVLIDDPVSDREPVNIQARRKGNGVEVGGNDIDFAGFFDNKVAVHTLERLVRHEIEEADKRKISDPPPLSALSVRHIVQSEIENYMEGKKD